MKILSKISLLLLIAAFLGASVVYADVDKDKDKAKGQQGERTTMAKSGAVGTCNLGSAARDLDVNNVRARLYNNGALFWKGSGNVYTVPKGGEANSVFASGIWLGGLVGGELRFAGTAYGPFEYWPGPLDQAGNPPADCSVYDRIWTVKRDDIQRYNQTGQATDDILTWPWDLGAPVNDGDGNPNNYNLQGGDRPGLIGDQTAWWVMNDAGNTKDWSKTAPLNVEVQVTAFAFRTANPLNNTTFYKYKLIYKGSEPLVDAYFGIWSDPDLGNASDDYVGSDTLLGIGFVYNGTDFDAGFDGYGANPPALAYDFFQGPLIPAEGNTHVDPDGTVHENARRIQMTKFVYYNNDSSVIGNPSGSTNDPYNYLRGVWRDGTPMTFGGNGYGGSTTTNYMFPGNPVRREYWSEENTNGAGARNTPADRRFLLSAGPFTMQPGDVQEIVYGIVWAQSVNRLASVAQMKRDDIFAQGAYDSNFDIPRAPEQPNVDVEPLDQAVAISWSYEPSSNNFLNSYDERSAFLVDKDPADGNVTYTFEGYKVYQYDSPFDQTGRVIATFDKKNNVTQIIDEDIDISTGAVVTKLVADGSDSGVQNHIVVENLTNWKEYYFGVQAYAYNPNSSPKLYQSPINRVTVVPAKVDARAGGTAAVAAPETAIASAKAAGTGDPFGVFAKVVNPEAVTGHEYRVNFYNHTYTDAAGDEKTVLTYDIVDATAGVTKLSGREFINRTGQNTPLGTDLLVIDGLSFSIDGAPADFKNFLTVANQDGPINPPVGGAADFQGFPVPNRPTAARTGMAGQWMIHTADNGARGSYGAFFARVTNGNINARKIVPYDFEIRFTGSYDEPEVGGSWTYDPFASGEIFWVPFELWRIGIDTPNDPSDDVRMVPYVLDTDLTSILGTGGLPPFNLLTEASMAAAEPLLGGRFNSTDHSASSGNNDPFTDWIYWTTPTDESPGQAGYLAWEALARGDHPEDFYNVLTRDNSIRRMVLMSWNGGDVDAGVYTQALPPKGAVFRIVTTKPLHDGAAFAINTSEFAPTQGDAETAQKALDLIGVSPNPYKGASDYEISVTADEVRFTNLPDQATVRVFTLSGTLIRTMSMSTFNNRWDLTTEEGLPVASGMYLIHVEVPGVGERVIKFGVVKKRVQLDLI